MYSIIEKQVIEKLFLPKKEGLIQKLVNLFEYEIPKLVKNNIPIKVVNFLHDDLPFALNYLVLPDNQIIDDKYHSNYFLIIDYKDASDDDILNSIISDFALKYEDEVLDEDEVYEWSSTWQSENKEVEYRFFVNCWTEAKKRTKKKYRALLFEHECWSNSYELDDKIFMDLSDYPAYLEDKGEKILYYT